MWFTSPRAVTSTLSVTWLSDHERVYAIGSAVPPA